MNINPRKLFLFDAIGALFSAIMLGFVLIHFQNKIGMPKEILYFLADIAAAFFFYSTLCYLLIKFNFKPFLIGISLANYGYCIISLFYMYTYFDQLTALGIAYFILEKLIVIILATIEIKTAMR